MLRILSHYSASSSSCGGGATAAAAAAASGGVVALLRAAAAVQPGCSGSDVHGSTPGGAGIGDFSQWLARRWATKKQGGSTKNKKDSKPKYLGTKMSDGALAFPGQLLVKQLGTRFMPGHNVGMGRDFTLYSKTAGFVSFRHEKHVPHGRKPSAYKERRYIDVLPVDGDWSEAYRSKVAEMVHRRNAVRLAALGHAARYGKR